VMHDLTDVAQRLRAVREAHERFLALYAVEVAIVEPTIDRVVEDVFGPDDDDGDERPGWLAPADGDDAPADGGPAAPGW
jgi:hypothetical protein